MILLLTLLTIKHFIFDFLYQPPWMFQNKGTWGHWGGIAHSGLHALATFIILLFFTNVHWAFGIAFLFELPVHYLMDYYKMSTNAKKGWGPTTHNEFWVLTGFDQLVHSLTYLFIAWTLISS